MRRFVCLFLLLLVAGIACSFVGLPNQMPSTTEPTSNHFLPNATATIVGSREAGTETDRPSTIVPVLVQPAAIPHLRPGDPVSLDQITMFDPARGWGLSGRDVLVTTDGAHTWREVTPPGNFPPGSQGKAQGAFLDESTAWIVFSTADQVPAEAVVWHTINGGKNWAASAPLQHEAYGDIVWVEFSVLDAAHAWLMVRGVYAGAGIHYAAQFFRTEDGGLTWNPIPGDVGVDYTGLVYADPRHGLLTWQTTGAYASAPPEYALTSDGGLNWEVRDLPAPPDAPKLFNVSPYCEPFQPHLDSDGSIQMLVGCFDYYDPPHEFQSYFYASTDGGSTWSITPLPEGVLAPADTLFFFDNENGLLLGRDIYRTTDGGLHWEVVKSVNWDGQFTFVDPQTGLAIARADDQSALVNTTNGGESWSIIKPVTAP